MTKPTGKTGSDQRSRGTGAAIIYDALRDEILRLQLRPGEALDETGLGTRFVCSRSPVREALIRLASEGLVEILPNRSTIVAPIDLQRVPSYLDALDLMQRITHRLAAIAHDDADLLAIREAQHRFAGSLEVSFAENDSVPMIEANYGFHMAVASAAGNDYFLTFYRRLLDEGRRMLHLHFIFQRRDDRGPEDLLSDHEALIAAITERDAEGADAIAHEHAAQFKGRFMEFMTRSLTADIDLSNMPRRAE